MSKTLHVIAATVVGFAAGVLMAPKSGKETREDIKDKTLEAKEYTSAKAEQARLAIRDAGTTLKQSVKKADVEAEGMTESAKASAKKVSAEAMKLSEEAKVRAARLSDEAKRAATKVSKDAEKRLRDK